VNKFLADAAVQAKLRGLFVEPIPGTPEGIKKRAEAEAALWGSLIRELKIEAD
jgi:tripartite-type tricarboxylate transporter receptor subunit TctC